MDPGIERTLPRKSLRTEAQNVRHLWYKAGQNATSRWATGRPPYTRMKPDVADLNESLFVRTYSIVTASRPIRRASSSRCSESWSRTACASRIRHSSSLIAGMSPGMIDGTAFTKSVRMSFIASSPNESQHDGGSRGNASIWRSGPPWHPPAGPAHSHLFHQEMLPTYCATGISHPDIAATKKPAIWSFATPKGFVIRCRANDRFALFLGSSAVEHSTVNRMV